MGPVARVSATIARIRNVEPREAFWGAVIVLAIVWFFQVEDPLLAAAAIPVEIVATVAIVRPHLDPPDQSDGDGDDDPDGDAGPSVGGEDG